MPPPPPPDLDIFWLPCPACAKVQVLAVIPKGGEHTFYYCVPCDRVWEAFLHDRAERIWYLWPFEPWPHVPEMKLHDPNL